MLVTFLFKLSNILFSLLNIFFNIGCKNIHYLLDFSRPKTCFYITAKHINLL